MDTMFATHDLDPFAGQNEPWDFWRPLDSRIRREDWTDAIVSSMGRLEGVPAAAPGADPRRAIMDILTESQFGPRHWCLSPSKRLYYRLVRSLLPSSARAALRTAALGRKPNGFALRWPIEDRYVLFQLEIVSRLMAARGLESLDYVRFWPGGRRFAFVLTHDIEGADGQRAASEIAEIDERCGFRSSFNFVPEKYRVHLSLVNDLKQRGFEVGVHGLVHDGMTFCSKQIFDARAQRINTYLGQWAAVGFRSPMTHRNPEWMQALEIEYDLSFFDTDPYEPMPGGTMSIWPFFMGRFVELPYTLCQDHTLMVTLKESSPRLWLEKAAFIRRYGGMVLLNAHPDYLRDAGRREVYESFLRAMNEQEDLWHALPRDAARWWRERQGLEIRDGAVARKAPGDRTLGASAGTAPAAVEPFEASVGTIRLGPDGEITF
jgi:hypothetical protein